MAKGWVVIIFLVGFLSPIWAGDECESCFNCGKSAEECSNCLYPVCFRNCGGSGCGASMGPCWRACNYVPGNWIQCEEANQCYSDGCGGYDCNDTICLPWCPLGNESQPCDRKGCNWPQGVNNCANPPPSQPPRRDCYCSIRCERAACSSWHFPCKNTSYPGCAADLGCSYSVGCRPHCVYYSPTPGRDCAGKALCRESGATACGYDPCECVKEKCKSAPKEQNECGAQNGAMGRGCGRNENHCNCCKIGCTTAGSANCLPFQCTDELCLIRDCNCGPCSDHHKLDTAICDAAPCEWKQP